MSALCRLLCQGAMMVPRMCVSFIAGLRAAAALQSWASAVPPRPAMLGLIPAPTNSGEPLHDRRKPARRHA